MIVVDFFERLRGDAGTWSGHERSEVERLKSVFGADLYNQIWTEGVTDDGAPWMVAVDHETDEMVLHLARMQDAYAILDRNLEVVARGPLLRNVVTESLAHFASDSASRYGVRVTQELPVAMLAALLMDWLRYVAGDLAAPDEAASRTMAEAETAGDKLEALRALLEGEEDTEDGQLEEEIWPVAPEQHMAGSPSLDAPETGTTLPTEREPMSLGKIDFAEVDLPEALMPDPEPQDTQDIAFAWELPVDTIVLAEPQDETPVLAEANEGTTVQIDVEALLDAYVQTRSGPFQPLTADIEIGGDWGFAGTPTIISLRGLLDHFDLPEDLVEAIVAELEATEEPAQTDGFKVIPLDGAWTLPDTVTIDGFELIPF